MLFRSGVAALTRLLGVPDECVKTVHEDGVSAYVFRVKDRVVAIAWCEAGRSRKLKPAGGVQAFDIMGNSLSLKATELDASPVYLVGKSADSIVALLDKYSSTRVR